MKREIYKILLTAVTSALIAILQAYLAQLTPDASAHTVPALAGLNGVMLSTSHFISKLQRITTA